MKKKLTAVALNTLPEGEYWDTVFEGLFLRVGVNRKTWYYRYRVGSTRPKAKLGVYIDANNGMGLGAARDAAKAIADRVERGVPIEPIIEKTAAGGMTLGELIDKYEKYKRTVGGRIKKLDEALGTVRRLLADYLKLSAKSFGKTDLRTVRNSLIERGAVVTANRLLGYFGPIVKWAVENDHMETNFVRDLTKAPEKKRKRVLNDAEIRAVWKACQQMELDDLKATRSFARFVRFLLAVPCRKMEAAKLRYRDIEDGVWTILEHKTDHLDDAPVHRLTLSTLATEQLMPRQRKDVGNAGPDQLVFPGKIDGSTLSGFSKLVNELRERSSTTGWTLHDLRRTVATRIQEMGVPKDVVAALLNHVVTGADGHYLHAAMTQHKAEALAIWNEELARILANKPKAKAPVIPLVRPLQAAA